MTTQFEQQITVEAHANYGAFRGNDKKFYKPVGKDLTLKDFEVGKTYAVKGYRSETGKTSYITAIVTSSAPATAPVAKPVEGRKLPPPPVQEVKAPISSVSTGRDFTKEAKGKTISLFIAAILQNSGETIDAPDILEMAESLVNLMDEKGYF